MDSAGVATPLLASQEMRRTCFLENPHLFWATPTFAAGRQPWLEPGLQLRPSTVSALAMPMVHP